MLMALFAMEESLRSGHEERILVVDDERVILELTSMILKSRGYQVVTVSNGADALALAEQEAYELVLLDYMMPGMDGMMVLQRLRELCPDTAVIMFTGKGNEEIAVDLMKAGASDYLLKPFNHQNFLERIENVLRLRRVEAHNRQLQSERELLLREIEGWNRELERRVEQKGYELERAHAEILQAEKLAALGHLSAGMAHEIRNPLNAIGLFSQLLKLGMEHDAQKSDYLSRIDAEVARIDGILLRLLATSKRPSLEPRPVRLTAIVEEVLKQFLPLCRSQGVALETHLTAQGAVVLGDASELEQVFTNLLANALYEMPHGGRLQVRVDHSPELNEVCALVADTGKGISREHLPRLFDPFFTTKPRGTGFGLAVVQRVVTAHGGRIDVSSEPGAGATFQLVLPAAKSN